MLTGGLAEGRDLSWAGADAEAPPVSPSSPRGADAEESSRDTQRLMDEPSWLQESPAPSRAPPRSARKSVLRYKMPDKTPKKKKEGEDEEDCCCMPKDPVLYWFNIYHLVAGALGIFAVCANASVAVAASSTWRDVLMHSYGVLFSAMIIAIEIDFRPVMNRVRLLDLWLFRGLYYSYVGFVTFAGSDPEKHFLFVNAVGVFLFLIGVGYSVMGMLCLKTIVSARQRQKQQTPSVAGDYTEIHDDFQISPLRV